MRMFVCGGCGQLVYFDSSQCLGCGAALGFSVERGELLTFEADGSELRPLGAPERTTRMLRCANAALTACNWMVAAERGGLCLSCSLTRTRPNDADPAGLRAFAETEVAKRRLVYQLLAFGLSVAPLSASPDGLAFDLLWSPGSDVVTGHDRGVVTVDVTETDDARRERLRVELSEPYRTMLGHLRHEVGHYYWSRLVSQQTVGAFRALFGNEWDDYDESLERHYAQGPPPGWQQRYVSAYATMHPYEDWAESFAHYLHIHDVLDTSAAAGLVLNGSDDARQLASRPADALAKGDFDSLMDAWIPLTLGLNAVTQAMGKRDLDPFVLAPMVMEKLRFVHERIAEARS
jgi:hypothetical protein